MDFDLSEEQQAFRTVLKDFTDREIRPVARQFEQAGEYPDAVVEKMKAMGLFGVTVPEEYGGLGLDLVSMALVFEELSRGWMGVAGVIGSHSLSCRMVAVHGTEEQKQRWLPGLATGDERTGIGLTEPDAGSDLQGIKTRAVRDGDHYVISGQKMWITNARRATMLPILVKTDPDATPAHRGMSVLLVETDRPGFAVTNDMGKLGYKGPETCELSLDEVRVPAANLLGGAEGAGLKQVLSGLEVGRVNIAARAVGIAQEALDQSVAYAKERHAFGQPIAAFQAIQLKIADMATDAQAARLLTWYAASQVDAGRRADREAGMAKYFASEVAIRASLEAMRIHGGMGYSTELDIERLYRDAPLMAIGEGTNDIQRMVIARSFLGDAAR
jgi:alkylation response protein AidB-like acyl-CoA dehydrogenase